MHQPKAFGLAWNWTLSLTVCLALGCSTGAAGGFGGSSGGTTATGGKLQGGSGGAGGSGVAADSGANGGDRGGGSGGTRDERADSAAGGAGGALTTGGADAAPGRDTGIDSGQSRDTTGSDGGRVGTGGAPGTGGPGGMGGKTGTGGRVGTGGTTGGAGSTGDSGLCPPGITKTITVAKDGSGQFTSVQAAVDSLASGSATPTRIDIKAGTYTEKLTIASRTNLCLVGAGTSSTILSYGDSNASVGSTSGSASVHVSANDFSAANLTIQNTHGAGSQAVALRTTGQRQQFLGCRFVGYQDTLYTHSGSQYFRDCYVQGNTDYVFGGATAVLQNCEVRNVEGGSATTAPNTDKSTAFGIVFLGGKLTAASGVKSGSVALARPWGADGFAAFLNAELGAHIAAAGFVEMSGNPPQNARLHEYGSTGAGANTSSRSSYQLTASQAASYTLANILGSWTPSYSQ